MNKNKIINIIIILTISIIIYFLIKDNYFFIHMKKGTIIITSILLSVVFIKSIKTIKTKTNDNCLIITYTFLLIIILFHRPITNEKIIKLDFNYLTKWIKIIFKNKIVFENIFGNIILFIPLGIIINYQNIPQIIKIATILIITFIIELIQLTFNLGIFDILDIILNLIGGIIGLILTYQKKELQ